MAEHPLPDTLIGCEATRPFDSAVLCEGRSDDAFAAGRHEAAALWAVAAAAYCGLDRLGAIEVSLDEVIRAVDDIDKTLGHIQGAIDAIPAP